MNSATDIPAAFALCVSTPERLIAPAIHFFSFWPLEIPPIEGRRYYESSRKNAVPAAHNS